MSLDLSIIIPAYNRAELLRYTLESVKRAIKELQVEIIVVDDGSTEPLSNQLGEFNYLPIQFIRQVNQGSIIARKNGLNQAKGKYVLFLDSDDLVHPDKLTAQIIAMNTHQSDVSYTDVAVTKIQGEYNLLEFQPKQTFPITTNSSEFYLKLQPPPHASIYRKSYLETHLSNPLIPENRIFDSVGDVWLFYNLCIYPAKIIKVDGYYTVVSIHDFERFTRHWEKLGVASLALMLAFAKNCPKTEATLAARQQVGECAFTSWRKLPRQFNPNFENKQLEVWRILPQGPITNLGGRGFQVISRFLGVENAANLIRLLKRPKYSKIRTIDNKELESLVKHLSHV